MKKFNINNHMYIQITSEGWKYLQHVNTESYIRQCVLSKEVLIEGKPWYRLQTHEIFSMFPVQITGRLPLFETTVMFDDEDLTEV